VRNKELIENFGGEVCYGQLPISKPRIRQEYDINIALMEVRLRNKSLIELAQNLIQWWALLLC
jgi:hypothetical protein